MKKELNNETENNQLNNETKNNETENNQLNNENEIKEMIDKLNISVETYHTFLKNEIEKNKEEQSKTKQKISELEKLLEPQWQTEQKTTEKEKNNYNAFWKGE